MIKSSSPLHKAGTIKSLSETLTISFVEQLLPDTDVFEHICSENERDAAHLPGRAGK